MTAFEKNIFTGMISADLQQGLELIAADQYDLAISHFEAAATKTKELRDLADSDSGNAETISTQPPLEI